MNMFPQFGQSMEQLQQQQMAMARFPVNMTQFGPTKTVHKNKKCPHGRQKHICKECGGKGICQHMRERRYCKDCKGSGICKHSRRRYQCKFCIAEKKQMEDRNKTLCWKASTHDELTAFGQKAVVDGDIISKLDEKASSQMDTNQRLNKMRKKALELNSRANTQMEEAFATKKLAGECAKGVKELEQLVRKEKMIDAQAAVGTAEDDMLIVENDCSLMINEGTPEITEIAPTRTKRRKT